MSQQALYQSMKNLVAKIPKHFSELADVENLAELKSQLTEGLQLMQNGYNRTMSKVELLSVGSKRKEAEIQNLKRGRITGGDRFITLNQNMIEATIRDKDFCNKTGLTNSAIGMLIRLGGCVEFSSGLLVSRESFAFNVEVVYNVYIIYIYISINL